MCSLNDQPCLRTPNQACPVPVGNTICGETNSLEIMKEFNRLYEEKLQQVDSEAGGDCLQEKLKLQNEWIRNLTQQNEMLVRAVQELEFEATERVQQLEEKLQKSAQCLCEVMKKYREHDFSLDLAGDYLQKIDHLENDTKSMLRFIERIRENGNWGLEGLLFYTVTREQLLGVKSQSKGDSEEGEIMLNEKERTVQELTHKINHVTSFGDAESMAQELKCKRQECESLRQEMRDMRQALTEEVATKHDQVQMLKREAYSLEERCLQADKQTAFKEDIIKELRKEIKQLKQQYTQEEMTKLNATIDDLKNSLEKSRIEQEEGEKAHHDKILKLEATITRLEADLKSTQEKYDRDAKTCKICRGKSKVGFLENSEVQADFSTSSDLMKSVTNANAKMGGELDRRNNEIRTLKNKVEELERALKMSEDRAANLQDAVNLYSNSISVLENTEQETRLQMDQQKTTIANLQQALVDTKRELNQMRAKTGENKLQEVRKQEILAMLESVLRETEEENDVIRKQAELINKEFETLQDLNFNLEIEHCDNLQDIDVLECQLGKYKQLLKEKEVECSRCREQMKKLSKQKRCYEEIIAYFKNEMNVMSGQLNNLHELLTVSNESAQEETSKVMRAFLEVQELNEKLSSQLCACEQKVQLESQMNQLNEAKICQLQDLVKEKETDLSKHDQAILNIRKTLNDSLKQNEDLQTTVYELNHTITQLQDAVKQYEQENCASKRSCEQFQETIGGYCAKLDELKRTLDEKTAECLKLEMAYNNEKRALKAAQKQLQETEKMQRNNRHELLGSLDGLKEQLKLGNERNAQLSAESDTLQAQLANLTRKEAVKDLEIKRYRKIVGDLKTTMMELNSELNKNLTQKEVKSGSCKNAACRKDLDKDDPKLQDICLNCPCEVEFYQKMVDTLKKSVTELKRKLNETQEKNKQLEEQLEATSKVKEELEKKLEQKADLERDLEQLKQDLQLKDANLQGVMRNAQEINGSKCVQLACAQEEIANLKSEKAAVLNKQYQLKKEHDEMQCHINCLSEKIKQLKEQADQYLVRIRNITAEKDCLAKRNKELLSDLKTLQTVTCSMDKQQRLTLDTLKQMETDFEDLKNDKMEICLESKNVIRNVRAWVAEQRKIDAFVDRRERHCTAAFKKNSCDKVEKQTPTKTCRANRAAILSTSPCSLDSQGTASFYDGESPPPSPDMGVNDWYSTTFKTESENDSEEDYCVSTIESLTNQMKRSNRIWMDETHRASRDCRATREAKERK